MASRHWLYFGGFVVTGILLVGVGLLGLFDALSVLSGGTTYSEEVLVLAMLGAAAEWVVAAVVLGLIAIAFLVATVVSVLRTASLPRSDRLVSIVERLEREYPVLRQLDASERVEPTTEDRRQRLKEQYVDGEISEAEFEREMQRLLDDDAADAQSRSNAHTNVEIDK
ncbi:SHOCT domain-containing protein [Haloterrigena sp. SYSU A558-1]|uniref:SHOCT domain-containing protein n=1 Tax=Haloterrigena gelatinilytica TaxID=2741724 RepID=A0A8J8GRH5_9EURY|nr:SHOCT domain-containing protein [Haloterrigena gelatinilytica]NUB94008.1 SHOCT domain-containing protein [Haloterrigena gelatinilytica]NUC74932.1 SHOCT domain-containing protein [Haloterrigena gelatinilytica]